MRDPVVLALQQVMQGKRLRGTVRPRAISVEPLGDDLGASCNALQFRLECGCFLSIGMTQALVARRKLNDALSCSAIFSARFLDGVAQNLAVALGRNRQTMFEIPSR